MKKKEIKETIENNISILNYYGINAQIPVWVEEMSELTKVLCKWIRKGQLTGGTLKDLKEEIADLTVCLDQLKYAIDYMEDELMEQYKAKVDRQMQRIEEEKNPFVF